MKLTQEQQERVRSLEDATGRITASRVVADAKSRTSPLHGLFTWDKSKAAEAHWLATAREIIGSVGYVHNTKHTNVEVSGYVRDTSSGGDQGMISIQALREDPEKARDSLVYTLEVAAGHMRRALNLAGPLGLSGEIDTLLDQIVGVQRTIRDMAA